MTAMAATIVLGETGVAHRKNKLEVTYGGAVLEHGRPVPEVVCFLDHGWTKIIQKVWGTHEPIIQGGMLVLRPRG